jgi:hypothetical protein
MIHPQTPRENRLLYPRLHLCLDSSPYIGKTRRLCGFVGGSVPTHLHECGEKTLLPDWIAARLESSPRAWRKRENRVEWLRLNRLIPAQVGKTGFVSGSNVRISTHPRARGKNGQYNNQWLMETDSSPPVWRKRRAGLPTVRLFDSSPCVWRKLSGVSVRFSVCLTHPRLCRENAIRQAVTASYQDSSLCVWRNMAAHIAIADSIDSSPYM